MPADIVGYSFDGASAMRSDKGCNAYLKECNPEAVYTWCYSHRLNLAVNDSCDSNGKIKSVLGLVQETSIYFKESYKRMDSWTNVIQSVKNYNKLKRPQLFSKTRWSKEKSLGSIVKTPLDLFVVVKTLYNISEDSSFDSKAVNGAKMLLHAWRQFENIVVAQLVMELFGILKIPTDYLQTKGLNLCQAFIIIKKSKDQIGDKREYFDDFLKRVAVFISDLQKLIDEDEASMDIQISTSFKKKTIHRTKKHFDENVRDEAPTTEIKKFQVEVFNYLMMISVVDWKQDF